MKLLLDTHVLIWWIEDNARLGQDARALIADPANTVIASIASPWEISLKHRLGKIDMSGAALMAVAAEQGIGVIALDARHLAALEAMPLLHRDPFDHLILAQAAIEKAVILTDDRQMPRYDIPCIAA